MRYSSRRRWQSECPTWKMKIFGLMWSFGHWEASANMLIICFRSTAWWSGGLYRRSSDVIMTMIIISMTIIITDLSITANDLVNICNSAPVRKNANSQPLVIVFAGQENVILTLTMMTIVRKTPMTRTLNLLFARVLALLRLSIMSLALRLLNFKISSWWQKWG